MRLNALPSDSLEYFRKVKGRWSVRTACFTAGFSLDCVAERRGSSTMLCLQPDSFGNDQLTVQVLPAAFPTATAFNRLPPLLSISEPISVPAAAAAAARPETAAA